MKYLAFCLIVNTVFDPFAKCSIWRIPNAVQKPRPLPPELGSYCAS
jgi:hypothetical protein